MASRLPAGAAAIRVAGCDHDGSMITCCTACGRFGRDPLCASCCTQLEPGGHIVYNGLFVASGLVHRGVARTLVHRLKYDADPAAAMVLGTAMAKMAPRSVTAWVPVPRASLRAWRHGVDPAVALCAVLTGRTGIPTVHALRSALWWSSHSRGTLPIARRPRFRSSGTRLDSGWVLVDDVATSGATLHAAAVALGIRAARALVATAPPRAGSNLRNIFETSL